MLNDVSTVFLDMDGTLLDLNFDYQFWNQHLPKRYAEIHDLPRIEAERHVGNLLKNAEGSLSWYCTDHWSDTLNVDIMALKSELNHLVDYRADAREFLAALQHLPVQVVLLTNAHPDVLSLKQELTQLLHYFDDSYTSHDFGHPKEHQQFWEGLQETHDYDRDASLLIDDSIAVLLAAREFGTSHQLCVTHPDSARAPIDPGPFAGINHLTSLTRDFAQ